MPSDNPGSLTKPQTAELVAFVLKYNAYPAGTVDLPAAAESLARDQSYAKAVDTLRFQSHAFAAIASASGFLSQKNIPAAISCAAIPNATSATIE